MAANLHLANVRPLGGAAVDLLIRDGRIAAIGPGLAVDLFLDHAGQLVFAAHRHQPGADGETLVSLAVTEFGRSRMAACFAATAEQFLPE